MQKHNSKIKSCILIYLSMWRFLVGISLLGFILFIPSRAEAHVGNVPFLSINGKYTLVNPTYQTKSLLNVAQDVAPVLYTRNTPLSFLIDTGRLPFSPLIVHRSVFRWSFYSGATFSEKEPGYVYGETITHAFSQPGSHVVMLEAEIPGGNFSVIDTVLVGIVPFTGYQYPTASVSIQSDTTGHEVLMVTAVVDPSVKELTYLWDVGKGKLLQGKRIILTTNELNNLPTTGIGARIIDGQSLSADVLLRQETFTKKFDFATFAYPQGLFSLQFGTVAVTKLAASLTHVHLILGQSLDLFLHNVMIIFFCLLGLVVVRLGIALYGRRTISIY